MVSKTPEEQADLLAKKLAVHDAMHALPDEELMRISDRARSIVEERVNAKQVRMLAALNRLGANRASDPKSFAAILSRNVHFDRLVCALEEAAHVDLSRLFRPPNLNPPGHLHPLIATLEQAARLIPGDTLTLLNADYWELHLAARPFTDASTEIYWGRIRLVAGPAPDPSIIC